jgi:hypothetical protein
MQKRAGHRAAAADARRQAVEERVRTLTVQSGPTSFMLRLMASEWSSLEVAKLAVGLLTPVAVALIGFYITRAVKRIEQADWLNRTVIERRMAICDRMAPPLNDLLVFSRLFGHFRQISPPETIKLKRQLDKEFALNRHMFSEHFAACYGAFMDECFMTFRPEGGDAQLRVSLSRQRYERGSDWQREWDSCYIDEDHPLVPPNFSGKPPKDPQASRIEQCYYVLMDAFAGELGVARNSRNASSQPPTAQ